MRNTILFLLPPFSKPLAAEPLNYNVVSFSESASTIVYHRLDRRLNHQKKAATAKP